MAIALRQTKAQVSPNHNRNGLPIMSLINRFFKLHFRKASEVFSSNLSASAVNSHPLRSCHNFVHDDLFHILNYCRIPSSENDV